MLQGCSWEWDRVFLEHGLPLLSGSDSMQTWSILTRKSGPALELGLGFGVDWWAGCHANPQSGTPVWHVSDRAGRNPRCRLSRQRACKTGWNRDISLLFLRDLQKPILLPKSPARPMQRHAGATTHSFAESVPSLGWSNRQLFERFQPETPYALRLQQQEDRTAAATKNRCFKSAWRPSRCAAQQQTSANSDQTEMRRTNATRGIALQSPAAPEHSALPLVLSLGSDDARTFSWMAFP
jgi:hypothetical protein